MVRGPKTQPAKSLEVIEAEIDQHLDMSDGMQFTLNIPKGHSLTYEDWQTVLRPKYLAQGWRAADWVWLGHGNAAIRFSAI